MALMVQSPLGFNTNSMPISRSFWRRRRGMGSEQRKIYPSACMSPRVFILLHWRTLLRYFKGRFHLWIHWRCRQSCFIQKTHAGIRSRGHPTFLFHDAPEGRGEWYLTSEKRLVLPKLFPLCSSSMQPRAVELAGLQIIVVILTAMLPNGLWVTGCGWEFSQKGWLGNTRSSRLITMLIAMGTCLPFASHVAFSILTCGYGYVRHQAQTCYCGEHNCVGYIGGKTQTGFAAMEDLYLDGESKFIQPVIRPWLSMMISS